MTVTNAVAYYVAVKSFVVQARRFINFPPGNEIVCKNDFSSKSKQNVVSIVCLGPHYIQQNDTGQNDSISVK